MLDNYLAAAWRNVARNRFYSFVSIACLAIGLAASFIAAAYVEHLSSYNRWIEGHGNVYRLSTEYRLPGAGTVELDTSPHDVAAWVALNGAGVRKSARIVTARATVRRGEFETFEEIGWADGDIFSVLPLPAVTGHVATALQRPDALVLTRTAARKYFGSEDALGKTLDIDRLHTMVVTAVIEDLPPTTRITGEESPVIFAAAGAAFSPMNLRTSGWSAFTYIRVDPGVAVERLDTVLKSYRREGSAEVRLRARPLDRLGYSRDRRAMVATLPWLAALLLLVSCMNFVNLTTARSIHRSVEVGVRKAAGAGRWSLIGQFMGEAFVFCAIAMILALSLCELSTPTLRALLDVPLTFEYFRNAPLLLTVLGITLATAFLSGFYPAVLLARFKPASVLSGGKSRHGSGGLRRALVVLQFSVLAALLTSLVVATEQVDHLLAKSLRFDGAHMLLIRSSCRQALLDELRKLPGVAGAACSESAPLNLVTNKLVAKRIDGVKQAFEAVRVDAGFLELYGLRPLAGRFFRANQSADLSEHDRTRSLRVVINETAVRSFGFESAQAALGRNPIPGATESYEIIGVVEDFRLGRFEEPMLPMVYFAEPARAAVVSVKLRGDGVAGTLGRIGELWKNLGDPTPLNYSFLSESIEAMHRSVMRQRWLLGAFAVLAVSLSIVGMLGLASSIAEGSALEIGVRKAFGASTQEILRLMLWKFVRLTAVAGAVGCVLAWPLLNHWLQGFADRIDLRPWMFAVTFVATVAIATLTVSGHTVLMARLRTVMVLRRE